MSAISAASRTPVSLASMIFLATIPPIGSSFRSAMLSERKARSNAELRFSISSGGRLLFASKTFNGIIVPHTRHTARNSTSENRQSQSTRVTCSVLGHATFGLGSASLPQASAMQPYRSGWSPWPPSGDTPQPRGEISLIQNQSLRPNIIKLK
jgi:hypothetical protein